MKKLPKNWYRLNTKVRLSEGLYAGTVIPDGTLVKLLYGDDAIAQCEVMTGPMDGFTFVCPPNALYEAH